MFAFEIWLARFLIRYTTIMRIAAPYVLPKTKGSRRVLLHTGVHTVESLTQQAARGETRNWDIT